ncbi:MAG TPA: phosphorylase, partial [Chitinophagales bacterium]|nr:phosphorylase [Chitinophagales bacterium]
TFVRVGTSGSLQPDIPVDRLVASRAAFGIDNLMHFYNHSTDDEAVLASFNMEVMHHTWAKAYYFEADEPTLNKIGMGMDVGITVTCPGFYGPQGRTVRVPPRDARFIDKLHKWRFHNKRVTNFEMETAAIYGMARMFGHRAVSISAIVANRTNGTYSKKPQDTMETLIQTVLERI